MKPSGCRSTFTPALGVTESPPRAVETRLQQETFDLIPAVPGHVYSDQWIVSKTGQSLREDLNQETWNDVLGNWVQSPCCLVAKSCPTPCNPRDYTQRTRLLTSLLSPGVCTNSCLLNRWCYPTISSSVAPFSFCLQFFLVPGSFTMSWLFASGGQSVGASDSASVLPMNIQGWLPLGLTGLVSLQSKGLSRIF